VASVVLLTLNIRGGIFYGMILPALCGIVTGIIAPPSGLCGVVGSVPSLAPTFGQAFHHLGDIFTTDMLIVILTFLFVDFFSTADRLVAVATQAGLRKDNNLRRAGNALCADWTATVIGATLGTSTPTSYVESAAGVGPGRRPGF